MQDTHSSSRHWEASEACHGCISLVIPTFNSEKYVKDCIESILRQQSVEVHIIVVDNNSHDSTKSIVREMFPQVVLVALDANRGYAGGCNEGVRVTHSDIVGFVNADCTLDRNCLSELQAAMSSNQKLGAIMPKICLLRDPASINTDGNQLQYLGFAACGNLNMPSRTSVGIVDIPYPSGAMMLVRRKSFEEIGGFDPDFFMYHEDVDLGLRLRLGGHEIVCDRNAMAYHDYEPWRNKAKMFYYERNRLATMLKVYSRRTLAIFSLALAGAEIGVLVHSMRAGWLKTKCRSYVDFLMMLPSTLKKRSVVQSTRKVADSELFRYLTATFESPLVASFRGFGILGSVLRGIQLHV